MHSANDTDIFICATNAQEAYVRANNANKKCRGQYSGE
jgi:hypothetical protein